MAAVRIALLTIRLVMRTKVALFFTFIFPPGLPLRLCRTDRSRQA